MYFVLPLNSNHSRVEHLPRTLAQCMSGKRYVSTVSGMSSSLFQPFFMYAFTVLSNLSMERRALVSEQFSKAIKRSWCFGHGLLSLQNGVQTFFDMFQLYVHHKRDFCQVISVVKASNR